MLRLLTHIVLGAVATAVVIYWAGLESRGLALPGKRGRPSKFAAIVDGIANKMAAARSRRTANPSGERR